MRYSVQPKALVVSTVNMLAMCQKLLKQSATDAFKTASKGAIQKTAETTYDLIGNKTADVVANSYDGRTTKVTKYSQQNNSKIVTNKHDKKIPKERYISPEEKKKIIHHLIFNIVV